MIYSILLISKGGVPIYKKVLRRLPIAEDKMNEESLVASIITAVIGMSQEVFGQNVSSFHLENLEVSIGSSEKAIVAVVADRGDKEAVELGRNILASIDKMLDYPDFEDGLVLSSVSERIEKFIDSLMEEISSPINKSISLFDDFLLLLERERIYEKIMKKETVTYKPPKSFVSAIKTRLLKKEKEILGYSLGELKNGNIPAVLDALTEGFTNTYWGNLCKLLFVKVGIVANTLKKDIPAPDIKTLYDILDSVKLEDFKEKGKTEEYTKLLILKDNLYKQLTNIDSMEGLSNEVIYFRSVKNDFREIIGTTDDDVEKKIIIILLAPVSSSSAPLSFINRDWEDISDYFIETWFMLDRIDLYRTIDYWEDFIGRIDDLNRLFYKMKRWSIIAALNTIPLYFDVLTKVELVKDVNLTDLKDVLSSLMRFWKNEIIASLDEPLLPSHLVLYAITIGIIIQSMLIQLVSSDDERKEILEFIPVIQKWLEEIAQNYITRRLYPDVMFSVVPKLIYHLSIISRETEQTMKETFFLVEEFLNEVKSRIIAEKSKITTMHLESIGFMAAAIPNYKRFVKNRLDSEKILSRGVELLEYIRSRLYSIKGLGLDKLFAAPIVKYYAMLVDLTREKGLADLVLLKAITLADELDDINLNRYLVLKEVLELYMEYIKKFGPMVPNWQKPIKECERTVDLLRKMKSPENLVAVIWKQCQDFRRLVAK
ncbi:MAG: hypothetical protein ACP6IP_02790 [Candidatus Njordarchaeia archaeon]